MTNKEIADLMRKGASYADVVDRKATYISFMKQPDGSVKYWACAWGLAFCGLFDTAQEAYEMYATTPRPISKIIEEMIGVDQELFDKVEWLHVGGMTTLEIARRLENGEI